MPVALVDFEAMYDGRLVRLKAGLDHVADNHELARKFPTRFGSKEAFQSASPARSGEGIPLLRAGPPPRPRPDASDFYVQRTARHEAAHAAAAHLLGWKVTDIELYADGGGHCGVLPPAGRDRSLCRRQFATICYASHAHVGWTASDRYRDDDRKAYEAILSVTTDDQSRRILRAALQQEAKTLEASPKFRWIAKRVSEELLETGWLAWDTLDALLRKASAEYVRAA